MTVEHPSHHLLCDPLADEMKLIRGNIHDDVELLAEVKQRGEAIDAQPFLSRFVKVVPITRVHFVIYPSFIVIATMCYLAISSILACCRFWQSFHFGKGQPFLASPRPMPYSQE